MRHWEALIAMFVFIAIAIGANHFIKKAERPAKQDRAAQVTR